MKKIYCIFICMLLFSIVIPADGINLKNTEFRDTVNNDPVNPREPALIPPLWLIGADQYQLDTLNPGYALHSSWWYAQEFKPTKATLSFVAIPIFVFGYPPEGYEITLSIRSNLKGNDLINKTKNVDYIHWRLPVWVFFGMQDITLIPEESYYIVCRGNGIERENSYPWIFDSDNSYDRGKAWVSSNSGTSWRDMENYNPDMPKIDFCFITYWKEPISRELNISGLKIFDIFTNMFPFLKILLQRLG